MRRPLPFLPALVIAGITGCGSPEEDSRRPALRENLSDAAPSATVRPAETGPADRREARRGLETAYAELASRLDSLGRDSLAVGAEMRNEYRRILRDAVTAKDNTKVHLEELLLSPQGVTPEIWEEIRARTELSLDSLRRLLGSADSTRKLESASPDRNRR